MTECANLAHGPSKDDATDEVYCYPQELKSWSNAEAPLSAQLDEKSTASIAMQQSARSKPRERT
jgi:hypothetical protein